MAKTYDPEFARSCLELNTGMGIPEEQTALAIAEKSGKKAEMQTALQALGTGLDYQRSGKSLLDILDEVCNPQLSYTDIVFEPKAFYDGNYKKLLTYDASLARLTQAGHTRHPRPQEVFSLLIANLEGKLTPEQKSVADDMLTSYDEWMSCVVYTRYFVELPQKMQQGDRRAQVYLPSDGQIRPAGRGGFNYDYWASRGVVPSAQKK